MGKFRTLSYFTGAVIIFTGINSMIFLKAKLKWFQWFGMAVVFLGLVITGLPDVMYPEETVCDFLIHPNENLEHFS